MPGERFLIVNADDFGRSPGINRGVIRAHENGIVTSASLMVRYPASREAAEYARSHPNISVGLHLDLGEWVCRDWNWTPLYQVVPPHDVVAVRDELSRQLSIFCELVGQVPSHIDSHQHAHLREPALAAAADMAGGIGIPLRNCSPQVRYCGSFYGQTADGSAYPGGITRDALIRILAELQPGFTELGCHPGAEDDLETTYLRERVQEMKILCDPRVRSALTRFKVQPCSFFAVLALSASRTGD